MATAKQLITRIEAGEFDGVFGRLYAHDAAVIETQRKRYIQTIQAFEECFGEGRDLRIYSAPGRTELGGNHTDHNNGVVMAAGVNLDIIAVVSKNDNNVINFKSKGFGRIDGIDLNRLEPVESEASHSAALIRGVAAGVAKVGGKVGGFDCYTTSDVLGGSGLSSSAAFEVCMGAIFRGEYNDNDMKRFDQVKNAMISQYAENVFFGKKVLRDVDEETFLKAIPEVRKVTGDRAVVRAIHFYNDSRRAGEIYEAIKADDFDRFLQLIIEGGHSSFEFNQNAYSIKNPQEQGVPLALAISQKVLNGRGAWRLQGGGFAGTIQAFVPLALLETYKNAIDAVFGAGSCHVLSVRNYGAVMVTPDM